MIQLSDGAAFDFTRPTVPSIEVIASSLAKICRFVGHTKDFYSVAQHSVYVSHLVPAQYALAALLHDASEAVLGDCSSPLKQMLPDFRHLEYLVQLEINEHYCPIAADANCQLAVRAADLQMLAAERRDLMPKDDPDGVWTWVEREVTPAPFTVRPWSWKTAEIMFLERYREVRREVPGRAA